MIRKIALNWNSSYTELAAEQLCRYCSHAGIADFSDTLILVPTAEAGRLRARRWLFDIRMPEELPD